MKLFPRMATVILSAVASGCVFAQRANAQPNATTAIPIAQEFERHGGTG